MFRHCGGVFLSVPAVWGHIKTQNYHRDGFASSLKQLVYFLYSLSRGVGELHGAQCGLLKVAKPDINPRVNIVNIASTLSERLKIYCK